MDNDILNLPEDLREMIEKYEKAKREGSIDLDLYSDEIRSLAHDYSGYMISEERAEEIIKRYRV